MGGSVPDSFTAYPVPQSPRGGVSFREGWRYALLIRDATPPIATDFRRAFRWAQEGQFEVWHFELASAPVARGIGDTTATALYEAIWRMPRLPRKEQVAILAEWTRSGGSPRQWAFEAIHRHPEIWTDEIHESCLQMLGNKWDPSREWAARQLSTHPDTATRAKFRTLSRGDDADKKLAVILGSKDRSLWVRRTLLVIAEEILGSEPGSLGSLGFRSAESPGSRATGAALLTLGALTEALSPENSEAERLMLVRIAQGARPRNWLRYAALRPLAHDTSRAVRNLIWETIPGDSAALRFSVAGAPEPDEVTPYWSREELLRALCDTSSIVRYYAYGEVARRRELLAADTILVWLRQNRVPGRDDIPLEEAVAMIRTLGKTRTPTAFADLMAWGQIPEDDVRMAVMEALRFLGDRRAAPLFRQLALVPCTQMEFFAKRSLALGLSELGDASDAALFADWARTCPDVRDVALEAVGVLAGTAPMIDVIREIEIGPMKPEQARDYELLELRVRERLAKRGEREPRAR